MCKSGRLGELCSLSLADCPCGDDWQPSGVVDSALWPLARRSSVDDLVEGAGGKGRSRVNYYDCLYAFYMTRGEEVEAARAQDELRERWVVVAAGLCFGAVVAACVFRCRHWCRWRFAWLGGKAFVVM